MSLGDDHGYGGDPGRDGEVGGRGQTRTRLPERGGSSARPARTSPRGLVTIVGVAVLLIAAIAFANRGGGDSGSSSDDSAKPHTAPTSASGDRPVPTDSGGIPAGFSHDERGAQSAAANYAVALGSADMFNKGKRDGILQSIITPSRVSDFKQSLDKAYSADFDKALGLESDGSAPSGYTFVSRTSPIGTKTASYSTDRATVSVWCEGLLGLAGEKSTNPVTNSWFTISMTMAWTGQDWKIITHSQKDGPTPVPGDDRASDSDEIAKAVEGYGGFTYAR
ncbi:hypothetical protein [Streptomyces sp. NPDC050560]|uniref:hypothetical protein n=1 Tax=Streptomyces sp. NPDC050560 TaxID=3365630 RepID=UPI0037B192B3